MKLYLLSQKVNPSALLSVNLFLGTMWLDYWVSWNSLSYPLFLVLLFLLGCTSIESKWLFWVKKRTYYFHWLGWYLFAFIFLDNILKQTWFNMKNKTSGFLFQGSIHSSQFLIYCLDYVMSYWTLWVFYISCILILYLVYCVWIFPLIQWGIISF